MIRTGGRTRWMWVLVVGIGCACGAMAQEEAVQPRATLPQDHEYQRVLCTYMATLTEKDLDHGIEHGVRRQYPHLQGKLTEQQLEHAAGSGPLTMPPSADDPERQFRDYLLTLMAQPMIGSKRGAPAVAATAAPFLLTAIEGGDEIMLPPAWPETLMSFEQWDYAGNVFYDNRALKLRAFVTGAVNMMMIDRHLEQNPGVGRPDWHAYQLVYIGAAYPAFKDVLPDPVRAAYEEGLRKAGDRVLGWKVRGEAPDMDLIAPVGLWTISRALADADFAQRVETYAREIYTNPAYFHPAGFWVDRGGIDVGFAGMANYFAIWAALAADWPFAREAVERIYRLRAHLILPEPDGYRTGPSHFNTRIGSPASDDQWAWGSARDWSAALITDEAAHMVETPAPETIIEAAVKNARSFNHQIAETPRIAGGRFIQPDEIKGNPWNFRMWTTYNFPASVNPGYEFFKPGAYAHRLALEKDKSPMLASPFLRGEIFIRDFEKAFVVARQPEFAVILHTGPIGDQLPGDERAQFQGPLGFGGGQLSAFWTPATGSVILGSRSGMSHKESFDRIEQWRAWPIHAVSGATAAGKVFTSARIVSPDVVADVQTDKALVKVSGAIPPSIAGQEGGMEGKLDYARSFSIDGKAIAVQTTISGDGKESIAELYESIPVYLRAAKRQAQVVPTVIEFQSGDTWAPGGTAYMENVQAVRLTRFDGAVLISFDQPRRVKLAPDEWKGEYLNSAMCRTVLIDMLENNDKPAPVTVAKTVSYRIE